MMNRNVRHLQIVILSVVVMVLGCAGFVFAEELADDYTGKTVILQSNDVHGQIDGYQYMAGLRNELQKRGADVFLVDSGDYLQGSECVSYDKGKSAITMMKKTGYEVVTLGNHEFDYGWPVLKKYMKGVGFRVLCDDVLENGKTIYDRSCIIENDGVKIGFFGVTTPDTKTSTSPKHLKGLTFLDDSTRPKIFSQAVDDVKALKGKGANVVIGLTHLGVDKASSPFMSSDLWAWVKKKSAAPDLLLDGHSHTVMTSGSKGEPILSTGTRFAYIGVVVIDEKSKKIESRMLYEVNDKCWSDPAVKAASDKVAKAVDKAYARKIGTSKVELNGFRDTEEVKQAGAAFRNGNRDGETNLGDLVTDALLWQALHNGQTYDVKPDHVVAVFNGGALRDKIRKGKITQKDVLGVMPFANQIVGVYVTGNQLLEALEASTQETPEPMGGFPQVSGIEYNIDISKKYVPRSKPYAGSEYFGPRKINRVTIKSVNGKAFSRKARYMVVVNDFCAEGGDTYGAFAGKKHVVVGNVDQEVVCDYIRKMLKGVVGTSYAQPAGRITMGVQKKVNPMTVKAKKVKVRVRTLRKGAVKVRPFTVKKAAGAVTYKKLSGSKKLKIDRKSGKVTVKKGTRKGSYRMQVQVKAAGNKTYEPKIVKRIVTVKVA